MTEQNPAQQPENPPAQPPAQPPANPEPPRPVVVNPAPDFTASLAEVRQTLAGLPERLADAVKEVSSSRPPAASSTSATPAASAATTGTTPAASTPAKHQPSKLAKWFFGIKS